MVNRNSQKLSDKMLQKILKETTENKIVFCCLLKCEIHINIYIGEKFEEKVLN